MKELLAAAMLLLGCEAGAIDATWKPVGPAQFAISECETVECLRAAAAACPYGYDQLSGTSEATSATVAPSPLGGTNLRIRRERTLLVQCKPPVFCDAAQCTYGYRCVVSHAYPGRNVCAL